jgi:hypothetical protein
VLGRHLGDEVGVDLTVLDVLSEVLDPSVGAGLTNNNKKAIKLIEYA